MRSHKLLKIATANTPLQAVFSKELGISKILSQILINRGIHSVSAAAAFLGADKEGLLDPYLFADMHTAVRRIRKAVSAKEKIMVYGDYDVDGITALALLKDTLARIGANTVHYLPHRVNEGYGLTKDIHHIAKSQGVKLLITVDCGVSNNEAIKSLREHAIDVVVTDHHQPDEVNLPQACAILNPKIENSGYPFKELAGVGVAYKLCQALRGSLLLDELDLVSLGTIADVAPLLGENRAFAKLGLEKLSETKRVGLKALLESARITNKRCTSTTVSFILAPRLNASGRMESAETSLELLLSDNMCKAQKLAKVIEAHNRERQKIEAKILLEAETLINKEVNFKEHKVIVIAKENWHEGVLGIVASKLADRFYRPAIVISLNQDACKGSGRSIQNFHLYEALRECKEFLHTFGGHAHAAGLVITKEHIASFTQSINRLAHEKLSLQDLIPSVHIDLEVSLGAINESLVSELQRLEPYGACNPEPLFYTSKLTLKGEPNVLGRETLKFFVTDGEIVYPVIGFGLAAAKAGLMQAHFLDIVYTPRLDTWAGESSVILEAKEIFFR